MKNKYFLESIKNEIVENKNEKRLIKIRKRLEKMFGLARVAILSERFPEIFGNLVKLDNIIVDLYKIKFTPKEVNTIDWKNWNVLDYFIYKEWEIKKHEEILKEIEENEG